MRRTSLAIKELPPKPEARTEEPTGESCVVVSGGSSAGSASRK